jgi:hypothetical protein
MTPTIPQTVIGKEPIIAALSHKLHLKMLAICMQDEPLMACPP